MSGRAKSFVSKGYNIGKKNERGLLQVRDISGRKWIYRNEGRPSHLNVTVVPLFQATLLSDSRYLG